jgi:hypothetical protein
MTVFVVGFFILLFHWRNNPVCCLGLLHGFVTVNVLGDGALSPHTQPGGPDLHFIWCLPFDLSGMGSATRS